MAYHFSYKIPFQKKKTKIIKNNISKQTCNGTLLNRAISLIIVAVNAVVA
jgi:hypothetical protein